MRLCAAPVVRLLRCIAAKRHADPKARARFLLGSHQRWCQGQGSENKDYTQELTDHRRLPRTICISPRATSILTRRSSATAGSSRRGRLTTLLHKIKREHRNGQRLAAAIG